MSLSNTSSTVTLDSAIARTVLRRRVDARAIGFRRPIGRPNDRSNDRPTNRPTDRPTDQPTNPSTRLARRAPSISACHERIASLLDAAVIKKSCVREPRSVIHRRCCIAYTRRFTHRYVCIHGHVSIARSSCMRVCLSVCAVKCSRLVYPRRNEA